jgi:hypothetical protein
MEGPSEDVREIPKINWADYINHLEVLDQQYDPHRSGNGETLNADYYGQIDGWQDDANTFLHDIITVRMGVKLYTRAAMHDPSFQVKKFLNSPEAVEYYEIFITVFKDRETLFINTADPDLAREIHHAFYEMMMSQDVPQKAVRWLLYESRYATMRSSTAPSLPLVDFLPPHARKMLREAP